MNGAHLVALEAAKLALQFFGALFIAWRAVNWAQRRYQKEKHWERRLAAYQDVISALGVLLSVLSEWEDQELTDRKPRGTTDDDLRSAYWKARRQLEDAQSVAMLLLPDKLAARIEKVVKELARHDDTTHTTFMDKIDQEWRVVRDARNEIVQSARVDLELT